MKTYKTVFFVTGIVMIVSVFAFIGFVIAMIWGDPLFYAKCTGTSLILIVVSYIFNEVAEKAMRKEEENGTGDK
jgi:hypothetical protein